MYLLLFNPEPRYKPVLPATDIQGESFLFGGHAQGSERECFWFEEEHDVSMVEFGQIFSGLSHKLPIANCSFPIVNVS